MGGISKPWLYSGASIHQPHMRDKPSQNNHRLRVTADAATMVVDHGNLQIVPPTFKGGIVWTDMGAHDGAEVLQGRYTVRAGTIRPNVTRTSSRVRDTFGMRTLALPGTDLSSSRLGFGLSGLHRIIRSRNRQALLATAYNCGIRYFDTAPYYGHGIAERELGKFAIGRRDQILIATKFGIEPNPWLSRFPPLLYSRLATDAALRRFTRRNEFVVKRKIDFSAVNAAKSLDRSLRALRTDHVDILYIHEPTLSRLIDADDLIKTLQDFRSAGKVRYFGVAGKARDCLAILNCHPALGRLLQVDAADGNEELELLNAASVPFHASFGHFRGKKNSTTKLLAAAIGANRGGAVLFSTTRPNHIGSMVDLLARMEAD